MGWFKKKAKPPEKMVSVHDDHGRELQISLSIARALVSWCEDIDAHSPSLFQGAIIADVVEDVVNRINLPRAGCVTYPRPSGELMADLVTAHELGLLLAMNADPNTGTNVFGMHALLASLLAASRGLRGFDIGVLFFASGLAQCKKANSDVYRAYLPKLERLIEQSALTDDVQQGVEALMLALRQE